MKVKLEDEHRNIAAAWVTVEIGNKPGGGKLKGERRVEAVDGVAIFNLSIDKADEGYTLTAIADKPSTPSKKFDITAGDPDCPPSPANNVPNRNCTFCGGNQGATAKTCQCTGRESASSERF